MADYGIKISKPGKDVLTCGIEDLIYYSKYPLLKIKSTGTGTITYDHDDASNDVLVATHSLGYIPIFTFLTQWYDIDGDAKSTTYRHAPFYDSLAGGAVVTRARPYASTTELRYEVGSYTGSGITSISLDYIYVIYYDPDADL